MEIKNNNIKYIGFYDDDGNNAKRVCSVAAMDKMNYIASAISKAGYLVNIVSPSWMRNDANVKFEKSKEVNINDTLKVCYGPTFLSKNKIQTFFQICLSLSWLLCYLLINTQRGEKIIVYHVPWLYMPVSIAKFFRNFEIILEVEEIYSDVTYVNRTFNNWEKKLLAIADYFLYSTDLLKSKFDNSKPSIVIYGAYDVKERLTEPVADNKIHLVYAGIIDNEKKGAFNALEASRLLSEKYMLHIIGFGDVNALCERIEEINKTNKCKVVYDGLLQGNDYIKYCQSCHVGLSTQNIEGTFLESSFPSKILSYLSMGLLVVSGRISCVELSSIKSLVTFYDNGTAESIAKAIMSLDTSKFNDSRKIIRDFDVKFVKDISNLLEGERK